MSDLSKVPKKSKKIFHPPAGEEKEHAYHSPLEKPMKQILSPFEEFIQHQVTASLLLLFATIAAVILASSPSLHDFYNHIKNFEFGFHFGDWKLSKSFRFWVNDILLTLFFFVVGLEIKREFLAGELTNKKRAILVLFAAIGGVVTPIIIYTLFNLHNQSMAGWAIPMATDTAFAIGIATFFKNKIPHSVFACLTAIAVIDDIIAILVIAFFYSDQLNASYLFIAFGLFALLIFLNYAGIRKPLPYLILGAMIWLFTESAGIHGTIAGILVAITIPSRPEKGPKQFVEEARSLLRRFEEHKDEIDLVLEDERQKEVLEEVEKKAKEASTPLQRWESSLETPIILIVLPLFAFVNAGIPVDFATLHNALFSPITIGIAAGLILGKPLGIAIASYLACRFRLGALPANATLKHMLGIGLLGGMGFTMSLFIGTLSFPLDDISLQFAKMGILLASLLSGILGFAWLYIIKENQTA